MNMTRLLGIAAIVLAVGLAIGYALGQMDQPSQTEVNAAHDSTRVQRDKADELERRFEALQVQADPLIALWKARADSADERYRTAVLRRDTVVQVVASHYADTATARAAAQEERDSVEQQEVKPLQVQNSAIEATLAARTHEYGVALSLIAAKDTALSAQDHEIAVLRKTKGPNWFQRHEAPLLLVTFLAGVVAEHKWGPQREASVAPPAAVALTLR